MRNVSQVYLTLVPLVTAILGFTVANVSYWVYGPLWVANLLLMLLSAWKLGGWAVTLASAEARCWAASGLLLVAPWLFFSLFAGMGGPPATPAAWVASAFEQQVRYCFLIIGGILLLAGFVVLHEQLRLTRGNLFSSLGYAALLVAIPIFVLNMSYWHSFMLQVFKLNQAASRNTPDWLEPVKKLFLALAITEVSLTYFATAAFAAALQVAGWFSKRVARMYYTIGLLACLLVACYGLYPDGITTSGFPFYPFMIPAIPFAMPFYIGVNLLRRAGSAGLS